MGKYDTSKEYRVGDIVIIDSVSYTCHVQGALGVVIDVDDDLIEVKSKSKLYKIDTPQYYQPAELRAIHSNHDSEITIGLEEAQRGIRETQETPDKPAIPQRIGEATEDTEKIKGDMSGYALGDLVHIIDNTNTSHAKNAIGKIIYMNYFYGTISVLADDLGGYPSIQEYRALELLRYEG